MIQKFIISTCIILMMNCGSKSNLIDENIAERFNLGMEYFEKEKYLKAELEFNYLILNNPGSKLSLDAQYYLAESMFYQEKYDESIVEYMRYSRFSDNPNKIENAEFKSCKASFLLSNNFLHDLGGAPELMDKLQVFIEKFPDSNYSNEIEGFFSEIRERLAKKEYEAGRLYLKIKEYESALIYFNEVISLYYDTKFADLARIEVIFTLLLQQKNEDAILQLSIFEKRFTNVTNYSVAKTLIEDLKEGNLTLSNYYRLYK
jgi:outer membrane protein assembly factor BamD